MRYKGSNNSYELNESYQRMIRKITKLSQSLDEYEEVKESKDLLVTVDITHAYKLIRELSHSKNCITYKDMTAIKGTFVDTDNMAITDEIVSTNKITIYDEKLIIDDVFIDVLDDAKYTSRNINLYGMFGDFPYIREIKTPKNISSVSSVIIISIPSSINTSTIANMLKFKTFPKSTCMVKNIDYSKIYDNSAFTSIDELKNHHSCTKNSNSLNAAGTGDIMLAFPDKDIKKIAVTLTQDHPTVSDDVYNTFHIGISNLELYRAIFDSTERVIDVLYHHDYEPINISGVVPVFSGIMHEDYCISVYKKIEDSLELIMNEFEPFQSDFEDLVFRITIPRSYEPMILKELKIYN